MSSLLVSSAGVGLSVYGRKQLRLPQLLAGLALLLMSALLSSWAWMLVCAGVVVVALVGALRMGL
ncbi:MAG TPA: hypothetical protein VF530_23390 [Planctomycetota bacterium]